MRRMKPVHVLDKRLQQLFGSPRDSMAELEARAQRLFPGLRPVVWEGDAETFHFTYVGADAERLLGFPRARWTTEPTFWADQVVHPQDRNEAVAYCALATGRGSDHEFEYRARTADGRQVWLRDVVRVIMGSRRVAIRLRGVMFDITEEKRAAGLVDSPPRPPTPSRESLLSED